MAEGGWRYSGVSPSFVVSFVPRGRKLLKASRYVFASINLAEILLHTDEHFFENWLTFSGPAVWFVSRFVPAIDQVARYMQSNGYAHRIAVVQNVIALNSLVCFVMFLLLAAYSARDFIKDGPAISRAMKIKLMEQNRPLPVLWWMHFVLVPAAGVLVLTKFGYAKPQALYYSDAQFAFIGFLFYVLLCCTSSILCMSLAAFYRLEFPVSLAQDEGTRGG